MIKNLVNRVLSKEMCLKIRGIQSILKNKPQGLLRNSYSQYGEDVIIDKLLHYPQNGFYIDVGANDPDILNNTKRFYKRGWSGINIEPDVNKFKKIKKYRKRDINLCCGVGSKNDQLIFYKMSHDTISTFSEATARQSEKDGYKVLQKIPFKIITLKDICDSYIKDKKIDFMSIDTEGYDMEVLKGNDWNRYRPKLICIEDRGGAMILF